MARIPSADMLIISPTDWLCNPLVENESGSLSNSHLDPLTETELHSSRANTENSTPLGIIN